MANVLELVSATPSGNGGTGNSFVPTIAENGQEVAFTSVAQDLANSGIVPDYQVYVWNVQTSALTLASTNASGVVANVSCDFPSLSADGTLLAFETSATNLVPGAGLAPTPWQIYVKNLATGAITLASAAINGGLADQDCDEDAISGNGTAVAFRSSAGNLVQGAHGQYEIYATDLHSGKASLVSVNASGAIANAPCVSPVISNDGHLVAFYTSSTNLVSGVPTTADEVYVKNLNTGQLKVASSSADGQLGTGHIFALSMSADGNLVAFASTNDGLAPALSGGLEEVYVKNMTTGVVTLASSNAAGEAADSVGAESASISADGRYVTFAALSDNLVAGVPEGKDEVYVKDLQTGALTLLSENTSGQPGDSYSAGSVYGAHPIAGNDNAAVFTSGSHNLDPGAQQYYQIYASFSQPAPTLTVDRLGVDNIVDTFESRVIRLSGTSDAIGQTVEVDLNTPGNKLGTAVVAADGTWSFAFDGQSISAPGTLLASVLSPAGTPGHVSDPVSIYFPPHVADVYFQDAGTGELSYASYSKGVLQGLDDAGPVPSGYHLVGTGDFDHDSVRDPVIQAQNGSGDIEIGRHWTGSLTFQHEANVPGYNVVGVGDVNADDVSDIILQNGSGTIVALNVAGAQHSFVALGNTPGFTVEGVGQIEGNGDASVVIQNQAGMIYYAQMADGALTGWHPVANTPGYTVRGVGDLNGDGYADIVLQKTSGTAPVVYADMHGGTLQGFVVATSNLTADYQVKGVEDVNRDGYADVLVQNTTGEADYAAQNAHGFDHWAAIHTGAQLLLV